MMNYMHGFMSKEFIIDKVKLLQVTQQFSSDDQMNLQNEKTDKNTSTHFLSSLL